MSGATRSRTEPSPRPAAGCSWSRPRTTRAPSPVQTPGPHYLSYYLNALQANGVAADVYDVDASGRVAPDHLGVLGHYDAVIWYTGDDNVTRPPGQGGGNADRLAMDEILEFRAYMNEGGRVLYTGAWAGQQYVRAGAVGQQFYDPKGIGPCNPRAGRLRPPAVPGARRLAERRRDQRRPGVLARRVRAGRRRRARSRHGRALRRQRGRRSVRRPVMAVRRGQRGQPEHERIVRVDQRHPGAGRSSRSSTAGRRAGTTSRAGRSRRTPATSTSTPRSPT